MLFQASSLTWDNYRVESYVSKVADATRYVVAYSSNSPSLLFSIYQEKADELVDVLDKIELHLNALDTCQYSQTAISNIITAIQGLVDKLALGNYSNLSVWVEDLDRQVSDTDTHYATLW